MDSRKIIYKIYWKIQDIIVPTLKYSQYLYEEVLKSYINPNITWLDLGCGHQILPSWRLNAEKYLVRNCKTIVGVDYDFHSLKKHKSISLKVRGDISKLPFKNNAFDLITANMVVEHLDNPENQFQEVNRVLKPGGIFLFHTPNILVYTTIMAKLIPKILKPKLIWLLQGRKEEDIFNTYYRANSKNKIIKLAQMAGFEVTKIKLIVSCAQFAIIPPLAIFELIWIKILMSRYFKSFRTNIIAILKKLK